MHSPTADNLNPDDLESAKSKSDAKSDAKSESEGRDGRSKSSYATEEASESVG